MKNKFKGFYTANDEALEKAWKSKQTVFIFDTNVLLNLYGYAKETRSDFTKILKQLDKRIWLPYHVALEYQLNRLDVIKNEKKIFKDIEDQLDKISKIFTTEFKNFHLERRFPELATETTKLEKKIFTHIKSYKEKLNQLDKEQPCVRSHDAIRAELNELFDNKVGNPPKDQDTLDNLFKEGEKRNSLNIPPGFKDASKDKIFSFGGLKYESKYGDLILWKQIIEHAKDKNIKNVFLISDDKKEDWLFSINSRGQKDIGPHAYLQQEILTESDIDIFHMYNSSDFLVNSKKFLNQDINDSSIKDANLTIRHAQSKYTDRPSLNSYRKLASYTDQPAKHAFENLDIVELERAQSALASYRIQEQLNNNFLKRISDYETLSPMTREILDSGTLRSYFEINRALKDSDALKVLYKQIEKRSEENNIDDSEDDSEEFA